MYDVRLSSVLLEGVSVYGRIKSLQALGQCRIASQSLTS